MTDSLQAVVSKLRGLADTAYCQRDYSDGDTLEGIADRIERIDDATRAELARYREREEAVRELAQSASALVTPPLRYYDRTIEIDCSDHSTAMQIVRRLRKAIEAAITAHHSSSDPGRNDSKGIEGDTGREER